MYSHDEMKKNFFVNPGFGGVDSISTLCDLNSWPVVLVPEVACRQISNDV